MARASSLGVKSLLAFLRGHDLVVLEEGADIVVVRIPRSLAGKTLAESDIRARTGLNVIAVQKGDEVVTNPAASTTLPADGEIVAIGSVEQVRRSCVPSGRRASADAGARKRYFTIFIQRSSP